jgi:DNA uptake protein ComE-like DNA-binding protein
MRFFGRIAALSLIALATSLAPAQPAGQNCRPSAGKAAANAAAVNSGTMLDINTATAGQLRALPGIGDAYADRIIKGRPYTAKNQLVSRGILPQSTYDKISGKIIAQRPQK